MSSQMELIDLETTLVAPPTKWTNPNIMSAEARKMLREERLAKQRKAWVLDELRYNQRLVEAAEFDKVHAEKLQLQRKIKAALKRRHQQKLAYIEPVLNLFDFGQKAVKYSVNTFLAAQFSLMTMASIFRFGGQKNRN